MNRVRQPRSATAPPLQNHQSPKRRKQESKLSVFMRKAEMDFDPDGKFRQVAIDAVEHFADTLSEHIKTLKAGKGGPFYEVKSQFSVPNLYISGYLDLTVDEVHGEVRRDGFWGCVFLQLTSLEWQIFLAAWNAGTADCSKEAWIQKRGREFSAPNTEKTVRSHLNRKLLTLGIRLAPRQPPRLIEMPVQEKLPK